MRLWWVYYWAEEGSFCVEAATADDAWTAALPLLGLHEATLFDAIEYAIEPVTAAHIGVLRDWIDELLAQVACEAGRASRDREEREAEDGGERLRDGERG